jgi:hypothetical protein
MQELSDGVFDENLQGDDNFRSFLEHYPALIRIQQKGTTLLVYRPEDYISPEELYLFYRSLLKKQGLRVVPSNVRLLIIKDLIALLQHQPRLVWRRLVDQLAVHYQEDGQDEVSKSYINDVMRIARRAEIICVDNGGSLANAAVHLDVKGDRVFQDAVIRCDMTYLHEIQSLQNPIDLNEAAKALYEDVGHARYLKVILSRYAETD